MHSFLMLHSRRCIPLPLMPLRNINDIIALSKAIQLGHVLEIRHRVRWWRQFYILIKPFTVNGNTKTLLLRQLASQLEGTKWSSHYGTSHIKKKSRNSMFFHYNWKQRRGFYYETKKPVEMSNFVSGVCSSSKNKMARSIAVVLWRYTVYTYIVTYIQPAEHANVDNSGARLWPSQCFSQV